MKTSLKLLVILLAFTSCNCGENSCETDLKTENFLVSDYNGLRITTEQGKIELYLFPQAPKHRANYIKLAHQGFFDSLLFHRVINDFVIQGGSPDSRNAAPQIKLDDGDKGDIGYLLINEFDSTLPHTRGMVGAARDENCMKASSGSQFYIVQRGLQSDEILDSIESKFGKTFPKAHREAYNTQGGTAHLYFHEFTVFGEVIEGMDIVDVIAQGETDDNDRPINDVVMTVVPIKIEGKE